MIESFENFPFYRGVSDRYEIKHPTINEVRKNRKPKDSSLNFHGLADDWFFQRFGVKYRSESIFLTSRIFIAQAYAATPAHVMRILPLSNYKICWSPKVSDLLFSAKKFEEGLIDDLVHHFDSLDYREGRMADAYASGHEVMLHCDRYIAIPSHLDTKEAAKDIGVILIGSN